MGTKLFYAVVLTVASIVLQLVLFFLGYQTEKLAAGQYLGYLGFVIMAVVLWLGIKAVRDEKPGGTLTYGQGVGAGTMISLFSGLMGGVYAFIHYKFINTNFADYMMDITRAKWAAKGLTQAQMDQAEGITRTFMGPAVQAILTPIFTVIAGVILSLIIAAFLQRKKQASAAGAVPMAQ